MKHVKDAKLFLLLTQGELLEFPYKFVSVNFELSVHNLELLYTLQPKNIILYVVR